MHTCSQSSETRKFYKHACFGSKGLLLYLIFISEDALNISYLSGLKFHGLNPQDMRVRCVRPKHECFENFHVSDTLDIHTDCANGYLLFIILYLLQVKQRTRQI